MEGLRSFFTPRRQDLRKNLLVDGNISAMNTDAPMTTVMYVAAWSRPIRIPSTVSQTTRVATSSMPPVHDQMNVSTIGTPHCGRAVFLGLLYETLIRMTAAASDDDQEVIINTGLVEARAFRDLRLEQLSGRWPSSEGRSEVSGCSLDIGSRKKSSITFFRSRELD